MRSVISLIIGSAAVFAAHVTLPFLYVSGCRAHKLPSWLCSMTNSMDPALWMILFPFVVACIAYNYVFRKWGISALATRRLIRWPLAFAVAFLSHWLEMVWILNTFGS